MRACKIVHYGGTPLRIAHAKKLPAANEVLTCGVQTRLNARQPTAPHRSGKAVTASNGHGEGTTHDDGELAACR
jgi:hypothetical protein